MNLPADEPTPPPVSLRRLGAVVRPYLRPLLFCGVLVTVQSAAGLIGPWLAGDIVDAALGNPSAGPLDRIVFLLVGVFALLGLLSYARIYLLDATSARILADLRGRLFTHMVCLTPAFHEQRRVGELLSRLGSDLTALQMAVTLEIPAGLQSVLGLVGTLAVLLFLHTKLTLVTLAVVPPVILLAV